MPTILSGEAASLNEYVTDTDNEIVMHLCKNVFAMELDRALLADMEECDFPGYAAVRLEEWIDQPTDEDALGETVSEFAEFIAGVMLENQLCTGVYVTIKEGNEAARLLDLQVFDVPLLFTTEGQILRRRYRAFSLADI